MADDKDAKAAGKPADAAPPVTEAADSDQLSEDEAPADPKKPTLTVKVYAPFKVYFEGKAYSVTASNETGPFDVLPHHRSFLCMLVPCDLIIKTPYEEKTIKIARALLHVRADKLTVFVDV